ncbi:NAD(P)-dependent dehydrogenase (short-subunit alcohol dehydrogenase family) [Mucilaginibacter sp. UYP25]|uniref:hypothetical protein n=1 Tax=unclassified Mucilaginibacter TaxID=2617802 RepID=UPI003397E22E
MSKAILITGTSTGFGKLSAIMLAADGHRVIGAIRGVGGFVSIYYYIEVIRNGTKPLSASKIANADKGMQQY